MRSALARLDPCESLEADSENQTCGSEDRGEEQHDHRERSSAATKGGAKQEQASRDGHNSNPGWHRNELPAVVKPIVQSVGGQPHQHGYRRKRVSRPVDDGTPVTCGHRSLAENRQQNAEDRQRHCPGHGRQPDHRDRIAQDCDRVTGGMDALRHGTQAVGTGHSLDTRRSELSTQKTPGATRHRTRVMYSAYSGSFASVRSSYTERIISARSLTMTSARFHVLGCAMRNAAWLTRYPA